MIASPLTSLLKGKPTKISVDRWSQQHIQLPERKIHHSTHLKTSRPQSALHRGDRLIQFWKQGSTFSTTWSTKQTVSFCILLQEILTAAKNKQGTSFHEIPLEEWRHWLEGGAHSFQIITDHKNLEYIKSVKCLDPRQAWRLRFFNRFQFAVTNRPGSKNSKADTLSVERSYCLDNVHPESIRPLSIILAPVTWEIMEEIQKEHQSEPAPSITHLANNMYHKVYASLSVLAVSNYSYVKSCQGITLRPPTTITNSPMSLVSPLDRFSHWSTPFKRIHHYSSHHFSKSCYLVPLEGLPTAMETVM